MRTKSLCILLASILIASVAPGQIPTKPTSGFTSSVEGQLPPGSVFKRATLELADGSVQVVDYAATPDGRALIDGDIMITVDEEGRGRIAKEMGRLWAERNVLAKEGSLTKATGINGSSFRWANNTVPFVIQVADAWQQQAIIDAMDHIEDRTAVRFIPRTTQTDHVAFVNVAGVCRSFVGRQGGRQTIEIDRFGCGFGQIVHEIGHALGLWHEHQRTDRDNSVIVHWNNIQTNPDARPNFHIRSGFWRGPFDFNSIMNYGSFDFSRNGLPTLTRLNGTTWTANRTALTATDSTGIGDMYRRVRASIDYSCEGFSGQCHLWGSSSYGVRPITSWQWSIYDGNNLVTSTSSSVTHTFQNTGPEGNLVFLEVTDSQGDRTHAEAFIDLSECTGVFICDPSDDGFEF